MPHAQLRPTTAEIDNPSPDESLTIRMPFRLQAVQTSSQTSTDLYISVGKYQVTTTDYCHEHQSKAVRTR